MHILIAPNAFKHSLDATDVAKAIREGLQQSKLKCTCECCPVGDGGDGTAALLIQKCGGTIVPVEVHDPLGRKIRAGFGLIENGRTAVIEMADASGLRLLRREEFDPLRANTFGTGELIKCALDQGVEKIIIGIGGSATVDGATGILQALGVRFLDAAGNILSDLPESLTHLESVDLSGLDQRIRHCPLTVLCDVENSLLGETGAAKVFGPQKGASAPTIQKLEAALTKLRDIMFQQTGRDLAAIKHGGAAGGVAASLQGFLNAKLVKGIDYFLEVAGFEDALQKADLVITGEGCMDEQTLRGKGPWGVALRALKKNIPVIGVAGRVSPAAEAPLRQYFVQLLAISPASIDLDEALKNTAPALRQTARELGNRLARKK
ncbi:MAG TPA: glycerate kinase [Verrucomicrobiae bacterium]|nr:glycerate kinase [Verrucomicrobiae bacterium]